MHGHNVQLYALSFPKVAIILVVVALVIFNCIRHSRLGRIYLGTEDDG